MGKLIVIEGLDGSGKSTQTPLLAEELRAQGREVKVISFPDYPSDSSALVRMYLAGEFGSRPGDVNAYAASSFYAVDRFASYAKDWKTFYERPDTVILATRYTSSNEIHQLAKLDRDEWDGFVSWAEDFEYGKLGIPRPDMVMYLDMRYDIAMSLVSQRSETTGQRRIFTSWTLPIWSAVTRRRLTPSASSAGKTSFVMKKTSRSAATRSP